MKPVELTSKKLQELIALADAYDQRGLYSYADKIFDYLAKNVSLDTLPQEVKLRIFDKSPGLQPGSMSNSESGRGFAYLKGGEYAYQSGKGQAAFRDRIPLDTYFV